MKNQQATQLRAVAGAEAEIISPDDLDLLRSAVAAEQKAGQTFEQSRAAFIETRGAANFTKTHLSRKYTLSGEDGIDLADGRIVRKGGATPAKGGAMPLSSQGNTPEERERREQFQREAEEARQAGPQEEDDEE
jgi:hypothetical protein